MTIQMIFTQGTEQLFVHAFEHRDPVGAIQCAKAGLDAFHTAHPFTSLADQNVVIRFDEVKPEQALPSP